MLGETGPCRERHTHSLTWPRSCWILVRRIQLGWLENWWRLAECEVVEVSEAPWDTKMGGSKPNPLAIVSPWITSVTHRETEKVQRKAFLLGRTGGGNRSYIGREKICLNCSPVCLLQNNSFTLGEGQRTPSSLGYWWNLTVTGRRKQKWEFHWEGEDYKLDSGSWIQERTGSQKDGQVE